MVKYIILSKDLEGEDGYVLYERDIMYEIEGEYVINQKGYKIHLKDIWVDYRVEIDYTYVH